ncbi:1-acyl-sn-glycerol-3-phosphate acyltransferase beta-like, partial [Anneissia japonica]|uniref:1-acyl-sn-glycerol-3-phosphate acyltransferase beta-like n=1 Tax=Anneissia japonica TaxID=1529436 RepID=UPI00142585AB
LKIWMYPEGTRTRSLDVDMLEFKKGAFYMAIQAQVPVVPVVMSCYKHMYSTETKTFNKVTVTLIGLPPFETKGLTEDDIPSLIDKVRSSMLSTYLPTVPMEIKHTKNINSLMHDKQNGNKIKEHEQ